MWFNILKNEGRRAAYRFYVNSLVHLGEFIPPKTPPTKNDEDPNDPFYVFESSNGHFEWEVRYDWNKLNSFGLLVMPDSVKPYKDYIEGMFEQEYPEHYAALQEFFKENAPAIEQTEEEEDSPLPKKGTIRKIMEDWSHYMDTINSLVLNGVGNIGINIPAARYRRLLAADIDTGISYKEVRDRIYSGRFETSDLPLVTIRAIQEIYAETLRNKNPDIVWEHFINFMAPFREEYMQHIFYMKNNQGYTDEDAVQDVTLQRMHDLARNIWRNNSNDVETLMAHLPNYN